MIPVIRNRRAESCYLHEEAIQRVKWRHYHSSQPLAVSCVLLVSLGSEEQKSRHREDWKTDALQDFPQHLCNCPGSKKKKKKVGRDGRLAHTVARSLAQAVLLQDQKRPYFAWYPAQLSDLTPTGSFTKAFLPQHQKKPLFC